jgi:hypothetical protein
LFPSAGVVCWQLESKHVQSGALTTVVKDGQQNTGILKVRNLNLFDIIVRKVGRIGRGLLTWARVTTRSYQGGVFAVPKVPVHVLQVHRLLT